MAVHVDSSTPIHALTVHDVDRMVAAGVLDEDDRVELLEGVLVEMSPEGPTHADVIDLLMEHFVLAVQGQELKVRVQHPLRVAERSQPEPDLAIVPRARYADAHPLGALLVVEVAATSVRIDRGQKARVYASAGVPEYWIVDVDNRAVEVRRQPDGATYTTTETFGAGSALRPAGFEAPALTIDALFAS